MRTNNMPQCGHFVHAINSTRYMTRRASICAKYYSHPIERRVFANSKTLSVFNYASVFVYVMGRETVVMALQPRPSGVRFEFLFVECASAAIAGIVPEIANGNRVVFDAQLALAFVAALPHSLSLFKRSCESASRIEERKNSNIRQRSRHR